MDGDTLYTIGDLARRTGLTVKTIRFYSDRGIVPPAGRSPAGHRLYGIAAVARLDLVRTLRELGLDLPTIRKIADRELPLAEVAAAHAEALAVQIRTLRLRRAVLTAVARQGSSLEEMELMHKLARLSEHERLELIEDFLDAVFGGLEADHGFAGARRSMTPELPDNPEPEQVEAWVELAGLSRDQDFRASVRRMAADHVTERARGEGGVPRPDLAAIVREEARHAVAGGADPAGPEAGRVVASIVARYTKISNGDVLGGPGGPGGPGGLGDLDGAGLREVMVARLTRINDPRRERYLHLLAVINGWSAPEPLAPALDWTIQALRAHTPSPPADSAN
ncbi:MerR family transcriptional regulator [Nonomuraea zeae]|uniref:MerR family transcriptional regulator n=1 Tax=Nonomuraea zeae TaxID=1642303 RepID=A0A5S4FFE1_9ACTN|nr:MerR family transcriptional regulator [Nonomuraea zeae]TMR16739.1 MerR family transcriptional regulator [Nonomuraea zeae]